MLALACIGSLLFGFTFLGGLVLSDLFWSESKRRYNTQARRDRNYAKLWLAVAVVSGPILGLVVYECAVHIHHRPSTQNQINMGCRAHDGVKEVIAPGGTGAYAVCRDGILIRTKKGAYWK